MTSRALRVNSFFTGIGGLDLAFERQGFASQFFCEKDVFCRAVLHRHWPHVLTATDVSELQPDNIPSAPLWIAGFPCQDVSLAKVPHGRSGFRGSNSSLFFAFRDLLSNHTPPIVVLENVPGLLNSHDGKDFARVVQDLTEIGYAVSWRVLNARYFGVPQSRPRVFLVAWLHNPCDAIQSLFEANAAFSPSNERAGFLEPSVCHSTGAVVPQVSYCISATSGRHTGLDWARSYVAFENEVRRLTPVECERLQGLPDDFTRPKDRIVAPIDGNDTERYRAIGNAVAIPVAAWVAKRIASAIARFDVEPQQLDVFDDSPPLHEIAASVAADFRTNRVQKGRLSRLSEFSWWRGGCAYDDAFVQVQAPTAPSKPIGSRFVDILEKGSVHRRYFISSNAAKGILRRVARRGRKLFPPLENALRKLASKEAKVGHGRSSLVKRASG